MQKEDGISVVTGGLRSLTKQSLEVQASDLKSALRSRLQAVPATISIEGGVEPLG